MTPGEVSGGDFYQELALALLDTLAQAAGEVGPWVGVPVLLQRLSETEPEMAKSWWRRVQPLYSTGEPGASKPWQELHDHLTALAALEYIRMMPPALGAVSARVQLADWERKVRGTSIALHAAETAGERRLHWSRLRQPNMQQIPRKR